MYPVKDDYDLISITLSDTVDIDAANEMTLYEYCSEAGRIELHFDVNDVLIAVELFDNWRIENWTFSITSSEMLCLRNYDDRVSEKFSSILRCSIIDDQVIYA